MLKRLQVRENGCRHQTRVLLLILLLGWAQPALAAAPTLGSTSTHTQAHVLYFANKNVSHSWNRGG